MHGANTKIYKIMLLSLVSSHRYVLFLRPFIFGIPKSKFR